MNLKLGGMPLQKKNAKKFKDLKRKMTPESQARAKVRAQEMLLEMTLQELRQQVAQLNQNEVAEILEVTQAQVSKLERRGDMLVSRLAAFVEALGGELHLHARFPDQDIVIKQFDDIDTQIREARR